MRSILAGYARIGKNKSEKEKYSANILPYLFQAI